MSKKVLLVFLLIVLFHNLNVFCQDKASMWADSVYKTMSWEERVGQLFMIPVYSYDLKNLSSIQETIQSKHVGGVIFMQGEVKNQVIMTDALQKQSKTPLFIGQDAEWGPGMRLPETFSFPNNMTLGAIKNDSLLFKTGAYIGEQLSTIGVNVNFAPVADSNTNPDNPVIGKRSFGESAEQVSTKALAIASGLRSKNIMPVYKHFPGHGDTHVDSHKNLPFIEHSLERLNQVELVPYKNMIRKGLPAIMTGHLLAPALSGSDTLPATLSQNTILYLRDSMHFNGLLFTDALNMKALDYNWAPGQLELTAFLAGNDVLLFPRNLEAGIQKIIESLKKKKNKRKLEASVQRILKEKYSFRTPVALQAENLLLKLQKPKYRVLNRQLYEESATVISKNNKTALPLTLLDTLSIATLYYDKIDHSLNELYMNYSTVHAYTWNESPLEQVINRLKRYNVCIINIPNIQNRKKSGQFINRLNQITNALPNTFIIYTHHGNPYQLKNLKYFDEIVLQYEYNENNRGIAPEIIFGAIDAIGRPPVSVGSTIQSGKENRTFNADRLGYGVPESVGMDGQTLDAIDAIAAEAILEKATPGCQILVARKGKIIYQKAFGYFTYDSLKKVDNNTIYDLASVTKVAATLQSIMFLKDRGIINLDNKASSYLPSLMGTNKESMVIRDILTHQAGLWVFIPFWTKTLVNDSLSSEYYSDHYSPQYSNQIIEGMYGSNKLNALVQNIIYESRLRPLKNGQTKYGYRYSDLGFNVMHYLSEASLNQPMNEFLDQNLYGPLGMHSFGFTPLCKHPIFQIAPTEFDNYFRKKLVNGFVHDPGAALTGGIAGHAGAFGRSTDLAILMQMLMQGGHYGGTQYYKQETVEQFTSKQFEKNRRGLGWDKPIPGEWSGPTSEYCSPETFGHTGFTGTAVWADPKYELVYIFLSNRTYPSAENNKLYKLNIRTRIQDIIYKAIFEYSRIN